MSQFVWFVTNVAFVTRNRRESTGRLKITGCALQAGKAFGSPHFDYAATIFYDEENIILFDTAQHFALCIYIASHIIVGTQSDLVVFDAFALHPPDRLSAVAFIPAGTQDYVDAGVVEDVAQAHDRMSCLVTRHPFEESIPVFRF
jgi:hypothetical protein